MKIISFLKFIIGEFIIIFSLLFILNNYIGNVDVTIKADGMGYYDYLPATFIYHDLLDCQKTSLHNSVANMSDGYFIPYKGKCVMKYPCGTAILISPFFFYAHLTASMQGFPNDGYSKPYQLSVFYAAVFYLFLGLVFVRKLLLLYNISRLNIFFVQLFIALSTSIINYTYYDPAFSHVYSFFAISAFLFFANSFFNDKKINHFICACVFLGIIFLTRNINILILLFIPFLAGSWENLIWGIKYLFQNKRKFLSGILFFFLIIFIQVFLWHSQTGEFLVYSYQGEKFNFSNPAFIDILFSYRKGLFVYAPVLFLSLFGLFFFIVEKKYFLFFAWIVFFVILTYVLSSWWAWYYGCSYGMRAYVDFYPIFCIPLGILIGKFHSYRKILVLLLLIPTIFVNVIQTYQYKAFILHWQDMNKEKYWNVFLKTDEQFRGLAWKKEYSFDNQNTKKVFSESIPDVVVGAGKEKTIYAAYSDSIPDFNKVNIIQVSFENDFSEKQKAEIDLSIKNIKTDKMHYFNNPRLLYFVTGKLNASQLGEFNYECSPPSESNNSIGLMIDAKNKEVRLKNIRINYLIHKP